MNILTRESFLTPPELARERVDVPALGGAVFVRVMTIGEMECFEAERARTPGKGLLALIAIHTVCDESGTLLFTPEDVAMLSALPLGALTGVAEAALKLNSLAAPAVDAAEKNSESGPSGST